MTNHVSTTQSIKQSMLDFNRMVITNSIKEYQMFREDAKVLYELSNKDTDEGKRAFRELNNVRNIIRKYKKGIAMLSAVNKQLKTDLRK